MESKENRYVFLGYCEKAKNFPGPEQLVFDDIREELLHILDDILCFFIENLSDIDISLLPTSTNILLGWNMLHHGGNFIKDSLVYFWI